MRRVVVLLALTLTVGCAGAGTPTILPPGEAPSSWSPLAVHTGTLHGDDPAMDALEQGTLVITDRCVSIDSISGERHLIAFRLSPELWSWDATTRELVVPTDTGPIRIGDGDRIRLGGGGRSGDYGPSIEEILAGYRWLSPPDPECITPRVFFASGEVRHP